MFSRLILPGLDTPHVVTRVRTAASPGPQELDQKLNAEHDVRNEQQGQDRMIA